MVQLCRIIPTVAAVVAVIVGIASVHESLCGKEQSIGGDPIIGVATRDYSYEASYEDDVNNNDADTSVVIKDDEGIEDNRNSTDIDQQEKEESIKPKIKVPYPVFVASIYKSGTVSVHTYFECGGELSNHHHHTGECVRSNIVNGTNETKPLDGCGECRTSKQLMLQRVTGRCSDIFTDNNDNVCWDPSVWVLDEIYDAYGPNMTILLGTRDSYYWVQSARNYGPLLHQIKQCKNLWPEQNITMKGEEDVREMTDQEVEQFYLWQIKHVREFARTHPSVTYIEISIEHPNTGKHLEDRIGIPASCWGNWNTSPKHHSGPGLI